MSRYSTIFGLGAWFGLSQGPEMCQICRVRPKFVENGVKHNYCSRTCARRAPGPSPVACILHGCHATGKPAFSSFCSEAHAREGVRQGVVQRCDHCNILPRAVGNFCIPCDRLPRARNETGIRELKADGRTFKYHRAKFLNEWRSAGPTPDVEKIYEIDIPKDARMRQDAYRSKTPSAVEIRTYFSSQCICNFGYNNDATLCSFKSCGICCVIKSSFESFAFGEPYNTGRFGDGMYSYRNSALADNFATSCTTSPYRVSVGCSVVVEAGSPGSNQVTNTEPVFVGSADGIIPVCIIVYRK